MNLWGKYTSTFGTVTPLSAQIHFDARTCNSRLMQEKMLKNDFPKAVSLMRQNR